MPSFLRRLFTQGINAEKKYEIERISLDVYERKRKLPEEKLFMMMILYMHSSRENKDRIKKEKERNHYVFCFFRYTFFKIFTISIIGTYYTNRKTLIDKHYLKKINVDLSLNNNNKKN
jgi:hypothetical protein